VFSLAKSIIILSPDHHAPPSPFHPFFFLLLFLLAPLLFLSHTHNRLIIDVLLVHQCCSQAELNIQNHFRSTFFFEFFVCF